MWILFDANHLNSHKAHDVDFSLLWTQDNSCNTCSSLESKTTDVTNMSLWSHESPADLQSGEMLMKVELKRAQIPPEFRDGAQNVHTMNSGPIVPVFPDASLFYF